MPTPHPQDYDPTRLTLRRVDQASTLPSLAVPEEATDPGLFKNELVINAWGAGDLVNDAPGIYLRVGNAEKESVNDGLIRIGPALVTDDPINVLTPGVAYAENDPSITWTGELWFRKTDQAFFVHDGGSFVRVTPLAATTSATGIVRLATDEESAAAVNTTKAVTPSGLSHWAEAQEVLYRQHGGRQLYVDSSFGDDSLENDGTDPKYPFLSLNRALLEEARQSYLTGSNNDRVRHTSIVVNPGRYLLDNRPGASNYTTLTRHTADDTGPINPVAVTGTVTTVTPDDVAGQLLLAVTGALTQGLQVGSQVWNQDGATGVVVSVSNTEILINRVKGTWAEDDDVLFADYSVFNSIDGGVVVPRGCSIVGADLRKCVVVPRYVGDFAAWLQSLSGCTCSYVGGTTRLRLTGNTYIANLSFVDNPDVLETHHLLSTFEFASSTDLNSETSGYYRKVYQVLGNTVSPAMTLTDFQTDLLENNIVSPAANNSVTDGDGFLLVDTVAGASPYISNCSLLSRFGARGARTDGNVVGGFKSFVVERFTVVSLQNDERAFEADTAAPGGKRYKEAWRHVGFEALNNGYGQLVSCFTIGTASHYLSRSGAELSLANCFVNFGDTAFVSAGHSITALSQDVGLAAARFIPPKPITSTVQELPLGTFKPVLFGGNLSTTKLYVQEDVLDEERLSPFSLVGGEAVYIQIPGGGSYTANLVDAGPYFGSDSDGAYINVKSAGNTISSVDPELLDSMVIYITRQPDMRPQQDRIYWLEITGVTDVKREPQRNFVLSFNSELNPGLTMSHTLFVAEVRDTDTVGNPLGAGTYQIALLSAVGNNDSISLLYPELNVDRPDPNSPISKTYLAMDAFLESVGLTEVQRLNLLVPGTDPVNLLPLVGEQAETIYVDFLRPSTIRAFGVGLEWVGFGNYSSALPRYQDVQQSLTQLFSKVKSETEGGRVYNIGMTHDGQFIVGDKVVDLRDGNEIDLSNPFADANKVYKNLTVTNRLFSYPGSRADFNGVTIGYDINTSFARTVTTEFDTYAAQDKGGFVRFATQAEANALSANNLALAPATLPISSQTQVGVSRFATQVEANALSVTDKAIAPGTIPVASETQRGVARFATQAEANALTEDTLLLSPGSIPTASQTQSGVSRLSTQVEANALTSLTTVLTPGTLPVATNTQKGVVEFATDEQAATFVDDYLTLKPSQIKQLLRLLKRDEIGCLYLFAGDTAPDGYLFCRGQAVSRATYALLFNVIGTTWGAGDGSTTFNLPPADRALVAASATLGYQVGDTGGAATSTVTSTANGAHTHTATTDADGSFSPTATAAADGGHTPDVTVLTGGTHTHTITVVSGGAVTPTGTIQPAGAHFPNVVVLEDGAHTHTITVTAAGAITPTGTIALGGQHTPVVTLAESGGHTHTASNTTHAAYTITGAVTNQAGDVYPTISINSAGAHGHGGLANSSGTHDHDVQQSGGGADADGAADNGIGLGTGSAGAHTHDLSIYTGGAHQHSVTASPLPTHAHTLPDLTIPGHTHTITVNEAAPHNHTVTVGLVESHTHSLSISPIPNHTHVASSGSSGAHSHDLQIEEVPNHIHGLVMSEVPAHTHSASSASDPGHVHGLTIEAVPDHSHDITVSPIPDHTHTLTTAQEPNHTHSVTVSTIQPYMAVNVMIYTGVHAA